MTTAKATRREEQVKSRLTAPPAEFSARRDAVVSASERVEKRRLVIWRVVGPIGAIRTRGDLPAIVKRGWQAARLVPLSLR
jgi:hypothetical protein